ncbi:MAG: hypothetical protein IT578_06190 [Verrucomicrobiae bacterium]|nr:hypothetical protein [Verrucomicrobiae bacterium]
MVFDPLSERLEIGQTSNGMNRRVMQAFGAILLFAIALGDYATGIEVHFTCFYLIPILLVTWFSGRRAGFGMALFSALLWPVIFVFGVPVGLTKGTLLWNALNRLIILSAFAWCTWAINERRYPNDRKRRL